MEGRVLKSSNSTLGYRRYPWQTSGRTSPFQRHSESAKNTTSSTEQTISLCSSFNQVVTLVAICFLKNKIYKQPPVRVREMQEEGWVCLAIPWQEHLAFMNELSRTKLSEYPTVDFWLPSFCLPSEWITFQVVTHSDLTVTSGNEESVNCTMTSVQFKAARKTWS